MKPLKSHLGFVSIFAINLAVYVATFLRPELIDMLALKSANLLSLGGALNLVSQMFTHGGFEHFFFNMLFVAPYALYLEPKVGTRRFVTYWLLTGLGASALFIVTPHLAPWSECLGASGACYGIITMALMNVDEHGLFAVGALSILLVLAYFEYASTVVGFVMPTGIAHSAHLGGFITALLIQGKRQK